MKMKRYLYPIDSKRGRSNYSNKKTSSSFILRKVAKQTANHCSI